ncbi:hypothetical protein FACS1894196_4570 [Clostridia bacterium]|nr:hypothetical protein FACS1894196_4570 [Clostridia bacterium]
MRRFFKQFTNGEVLPWERDFTREALRVAIPVTIQALFASLLFIVDNIMIGQLGEVEMAAVTQANRVTFLFHLALFGLTGGTAAFVAQFWGKKDLRGIRAAMGLSLCVSLLLATAFVIPCLLMPRGLLSLLLREEGLLD